MTERFEKELNEDKITILEEFYSIQGEGFNTGKAAYFVRTGGCDLACRWCDSKESWKPEEHQFVSIKNILKRVAETSADTIVVTGGEPLIYNFDRFCELAKENKQTLMIETCGAHEYSGNWDWVCLSPKKQKPPQSIYFQKLNELKVIIYDKTDLEWAEECANKVSDNCVLFLQPEWSRFEETGKVVVEYVKNNTKWNVSVQAHKFLKIP
ncbi:MAG: 7-carboxy-7-deazaguanine synthase QueE [Marinilabiliales bacterium]|nr:MAG: 7-carboxy-7-deazaguanine synthase QueE [Marinilabiliales bacterium]